MSHYLTKQALFKCPHGIIFRIGGGLQDKVFYNGLQVLTREARLSPLNSPAHALPDFDGCGQWHNPILQ